MSRAAVRLCDAALRDLDELELAVGEWNAEIAVTLNNLAVAVVELSLSPVAAREAGPLFERVIEILARTPAGDPPTMATVLFNSAAVQCLAYQWWEAQLTYVRAIEGLSGHETPYPEDLKAAADGLAYAIFYAGEEDAWHESPERTRAHLDGVASRIEAALGPNHVVIATVLEERAQVGLGWAPTTGGAIMQYYSTGTPGELLDAIEVTRRALAIRTHAYGETHAEVSGTLADLAALHRGLGDEELARQLEQRAEAVFDASPPFSRDDPVRPFLRALAHGVSSARPGQAHDVRLATPRTASPKLSPR